MMIMTLMILMTIMLMLMIYNEIGYDDVIYFISLSTSKKNDLKKLLLHVSSLTTITKLEKNYFLFTQFSK